MFCAYRVHLLEVEWIAVWDRLQELHSTVCIGEISMFVLLYGMTFCLEVYDETERNETKWNETKRNETNRPITARLLFFSRAVIGQFVSFRFVSFPFVIHFKSVCHTSTNGLLGRGRGTRTQHATASQGSRSYRIWIVYTTAICAILAL